ncbi:MAG: PEP-CTERM sorting domain-containing protein [Gemmataceae bacterium]
MNDFGSVVGVGTNPSGQSHAFLLTGVPEPSSILLAALGVGGLALRRWRAKARRG